MNTYYDTIEAFLNEYGANLISCEIQSTESNEVTILVTSEIDSVEYNQLFTVYYDSNNSCRILHIEDYDNKKAEEAARQYLTEANYLTQDDRLEVIKRTDNRFIVGFSDYDNNPCWVTVEHENGIYSVTEDCTDFSIIRLKALSALKESYSISPPAMFFYAGSRKNHIFYEVVELDNTPTLTCFTVTVIYDECYVSLEERSFAE